MSNKEGYLGFRVSEENKSLFIEKIRKLGYQNPSEYLHEVVVKLVEEH